MRSETVGRDNELVAIETFLAGPLPAALLIRGVAGAGKTTLWREAIARAGRYRVVSCVATQPEAAAGLRRTRRPAPRCLLRRPAATAAPFARRGAAAGRAGRAAQPARRGRRSARLAPGARARRAVARSDRRRAMAGRAQRCRARFRRPSSRIGAGRTADRLANRGRRTSPARLAPITVDVGPLSLGAIHRIVSSHLGVTLTRPTLRRLHETSGGNPFFALELGRALVRRGATAPPGPLDVPSSLIGGDAGATGNAALRDPRGAAGGRCGRRIGGRLDAGARSRGRGSHPRARRPHAALQPSVAGLDGVCGVAHRRPVAPCIADWRTRRAASSNAPGTSASRPSSQTMRSQQRSLAAASRRSRAAPPRSARSCLAMPCD